MQQEINQTKEDCEKQIKKMHDNFLLKEATLKKEMNAHINSVLSEQKTFIEKLQADFHEA